MGTTLLRQVSNRISAGVFAGYTPEVTPSTPTPSQPIQGAESILHRHAHVMSEAASTFGEAPPPDHVKQASHNHTNALPQQQQQTLPDPQHDSSLQQESSDSRFSRKQQLADSAKQHTAALAEGSAHTAPNRPKSVLSEASEQEAIHKAAELQQSQGKLQRPAGAPADSPAVEQASLPPLGKSSASEIRDGIFGDTDTDDTKQAPAVDSAFLSQNSDSPADDDLFSVPDADDEDAWDFDRAQYPQQEVRPDETVDVDDYDSDADGDGDDEYTPDSLALALANFLAMRSYAVDGAGEDSLGEEEEAAAESLRVASVHWVGISIVDRQALANPPVGDPQDPANSDKDLKELTDLTPGNVQGSSESALPHSGPALPAGGPDGINSPEAAVETALPHNSGGLSNAESQGTTLGSAVAVSQPSNAVAQIRHARQVSKLMKGQKSGKALVSGLPTCDEDNEEVVSDAVQDDGVVCGVVSEQQAEPVLVNEDLAVHIVKEEGEAVHNTMQPAVKIFVEDGGQVGRRKKKNMKKQSWLGSVFCCGCSSTK